MLSSLAVRKKLRMSVKKKPATVAIRLPRMMTPRMEL